jgi:hypothetical protein
MRGEVHEEYIDCLRLAGHNNEVSGILYVAHDICG